MRYEDTKFPARLLFTAVAQGMGDFGFALAGPVGARSVSAATGGTFCGPRLAGTVVAEHSNEWRLGSQDDPARLLVEGLVTLQSAAGETILMSYRGKRSGRYGASGARAGAIFEVNAAGPLDWLNDVSAALYIEQVGADLRFTAYELLDRPAEDGLFLEVAPLYRMSGEGSIGKRHAIAGQTGDRYLTMAEEGCHMAGVLTGTWLKGFAWGPHRTGRAEGSFPWHIDMRVAIRSGEGIGIVQQYMGAISRGLVSPDPQADHSWRTIAIYETELGGPLGWLNDIVAVGKGWKDGGEAHYLYYTLV